MRNDLLNVDELIVRRLTTVDEMRQCVDLQLAAWNFDLLDTMPHHFFIAVLDLGGLVVGAYKEDALIGFLYTLPRVALRAAPHLLVDMVAVRPEWQGQGVGYRLFMGLAAELREHAPAYGLMPRLVWTFDPWVGSNARLYLSKLGGVVTSFTPDMYGAMTGINAGLRTDRFHVCWEPFSPSPAQAGEFALTEDSRVNRVRVVGGLPHPEAVRLDLHLPQIHMLVPHDFTALKEADLSLAAAWQRALAPAFEHYLAAGYQGTHYLTQHDQGLSMNVYGFQSLNIV